jgi:curli biogenesis system outer membrane secretion channel CsgG
MRRFVMQPGTAARAAILALSFVAPAGSARADDAAASAPAAPSSDPGPRARRSGPKPVVTIYEFKSAIPEVSARAITDMFVTALAKSGAFAVAERARLDESVDREREANAAGRSTGDLAKRKLTGASYLVTGAISEHNEKEATSETGLSLGGAVLGSKAQRASIGLDVRILDAETGLVNDAVSVRRSIHASQKRAGGLGQLLGRKAAVLAETDVNIGRTSGEGRDQVVRACVEAAVQEIVERYAAE